MKRLLSLLRTRWPLSSKVRPLLVTVFSLCLIFLTPPAQAQKLDAAKVPAAVKTAFTKQYPGIDKVKWEKEGGNYEAGFKQKDQSMSALFTPEGNMTESEVAIPVASLPAPILSWIKENRKGATIKEAAKITKASGEINYEAEVKGMDLLFTTDGKFLKEAKD